MIHRILFICGGLISLSLLTACGRKDTTSPQAPPPSTNASPVETKEDAPLFDADKGLYLPEATRQSMGVTTAPVQKKSFQAEKIMKFQVFRESDEQPLPGMSYRSGYAYASIIVTDSKTGLEIGQTGEVMDKQDSGTSFTPKLFHRGTLPNSSQTELLVEITDPQHRFALGEFCTVRWQMAAVDAPAAVPDAALLKTTEGNFVYLQKGDRFVRAEVKPGATGEGFTEITDGVAAGDSVVTNPVQTLWLTELKLKSGGSEP